MKKLTVFLLTVFCINMQLNSSEVDPETSANYFSDTDFIKVFSNKAANHETAHIYEEIRQEINPKIWKNIEQNVIHDLEDKFDTILKDVVQRFSKVANLTLLREVLFLQHAKLYNNQVVNESYIVALIFEHVFYSRPDIAQEAMQQFFPGSFEKVIEEANQIHAELHQAVKEIKFQIIEMNKVAKEQIAKESKLKKCFNKAKNIIISKL